VEDLDAKKRMTTVISSSASEEIVAKMRGAFNQVDASKFPPTFWVDDA